jgi:rhamnose transport system substrate-binding protein
MEEKLTMIKKYPRHLVVITVMLITVATAAGWGTSTISAARQGAQAHAKKYVIAFVPKLINIGYFNAMEKGGYQAAKDLGVTFDYEGPTTADAALQVKTIKQLIAKHVDAIAVAPDDPAVVAPALQQAEAQGIKTFTSDTDAPGTVRRVFVNQALGTAIGNTTMDVLANAMGKQGQWAIDSCGPAAQNLNTWIRIERARARAMYPKMRLIATVYSGEDIAKAVSDSKDLITGHPALRGIIGQCSTSAPGAAKAVTDLHKIGKVFATGISVPSSMRPYVKNGSVKSFVLWDPVKLGYLTVWAGLQLAQGKSFKQLNMVPHMGMIRYFSGEKMLLLGKPLVFNRANVDQYQF